MESIDLLKKNRMKVTSARVLISELLMASEKPLTVEYIYNLCAVKDKSLNLSTVYRTLELFEKKCLIEKFDLGDGKYSYSFKRDSHKHILQCSVCHKKIEVECPMKQVEEIIKSKTGFTMTEHELMIKGVCDECKKNEK